MVTYPFNPITARSFALKMCENAEWVKTRRYTGTKDGKPQHTMVHYYNAPVALDTETTSAYIDESGYAIDYATVVERRKRIKDYSPQKFACVYVWQMQAGDDVLIGRKIEDLVPALEAITGACGLSEAKRVIVWIHNESFDFQFFRKHFHFSKVFALDERKPVYAVTDTGIEFRCSLTLSGYGLAKLAENLTEHTLKKLVGDLDYELMRHYDTPLTDKELAYCVEDTTIVCAYISEQIKACGGIHKIPLTKTGYVRNYMRGLCLGTGKRDAWKRRRYLDLMSRLTLTPELYDMLKAAFQGGYTHAASTKVPVPLTSGKLVEKIWEDVTSFDFTSSYPFVMLSEMFPMSRFTPYRPKDEDDFAKQLKLYACLFDLTLYDVETREGVPDYYISASKCTTLKGADIANGRVVSASEVKLTITEQDYEIITRAYTWKRFKVRRFHRAVKDYLPRDYVWGVLDLYKQKTEYKDKEGYEAEYQHAKEMVNACFGMMVMDPLQDLVLYDDEWVGKETPDKDEALEQYNNSQGRFLYYAWGVWVTAYARRNLWSGILEFGDDFIYADTDSCKILNAEAHREYIDRYNAWTARKCAKLARHYGIDIEMWAPKTVDNVQKPLGVWDFDGHYRRFKTLGAKRYMVEYSDDPRNGKKKRNTISITVAGLNKKTTVPWLMAEAGGDVESAFRLFNIGLKVPPEATGKKTHGYIDDALTVTMVDYTGIEREVTALSGVHLEPAGYDMQAEEYVNFLCNLIYEEAEA